MVELSGGQDGAPAPGLAPRAWTGLAHPAPSRAPQGDQVALSLGTAPLFHTWGAEFCGLWQRHWGRTSVCLEPAVPGTVCLDKARDSPLPPCPCPMAAVFSPSQAILKSWLRNPAGCRSLVETDAGQGQPRTAPF